MGFITAVDEIRHLVEFGVVFLLFSVGIELTPSRPRVMRRRMQGLGTAQALVTGTVITLTALVLGLSPCTALITGFRLALSSTVFGPQILPDKSEFFTAYGRSALQCPVGIRLLSWRHPRFWSSYGSKVDEL